MLLRRVYSPVPLTTRPPLQPILYCQYPLFEPISKFPILVKFWEGCKSVTGKLDRCMARPCRRVSQLVPVSFAYRISQPLYDRPTTPSTPSGPRREVASSMPT